MAELFGKDRTVIGKHIKNAIEEGEIDPKVVCANFAHITRHGAMADRVQQHEIVCYNVPQGRHETDRRPYARRPHGDDR